MKHVHTNMGCAIGAALLLGTAASAASRDITIITLVRDGDAVPGVGNVTSIDNLCVNNAGDWLVESDTDHANTDADGVLLRTGDLYWREDDALQAPSGARLDSFDSDRLSDFAHSGFNFFLDGTSGSTDDSGVYADFFGPGSDPFTATVLVVQESEEAPGLTPGTPFIGFFEVRINDLDHLLVVASVDDPNIETTVDRVLYILQSDPDDGGITGWTLIAKESDILPGQTEPVSDFGTGPHESAFNDSDHVLYAADLAGDTSMNAVVYLFDGATHTLLAQEGSPSPIAGRNWLTLTSIELDLNNTDQYVYSGSLDGDTATNTVIVKDGAKFMQEGDEPPGVGGGFAITSFGSGPVLIADTGDVLWYGDWNDPDTDVDTGLFLNDTLLVQEGVTKIDGLVVDTLRGIQDGYEMSDDGRYIIFEAQLAGLIDGAFLIDLGAPCPWDCEDEPDGAVGIDDLVAIINHWGPCPDPPDSCPWDCEDEPDGQVGIDDLVAVINHWGPCP